MSYIVSAQKATSVNKAVSGHFTSLNQISLIIRFVIRLEINLKDDFNKLINQYIYVMKKK